MAVDTQVQLCVLSLKIAGGGKMIGETYNMRNPVALQAVEDARYLTAWRASTLALGCTVERAIVVVKGGAPTSWSAADKILNGMQGVFTVNAYKNAVNLNTLSNGIEIRQETEIGNHVTKLYRGAPDWIINDAKLQLNNSYDINSKWSDPLVYTGEDFPLTTVYPYSDSAPSPAATGTGTGNPLNTGYVTLTEAWQNFLQAVGALTCFARYGNYIANPDNPSQPLKGFQVQTWNKAVIQGVKDRTPKRP